MSDYCLAYVCLSRNPTTRGSYNSRVSRVVCLLFWMMLAAAAWEEGSSCIGPSQTWRPTSACGLSTDILQETLRLSNPVASRITQPKQPRLFKAESQSPTTPLCRFFAILSQICAGFSATSVLASNRMGQLQTSYDLALARASIQFTGDGRSSAIL